MSSRGNADLRAAQAVADTTFHRDKLLLCASLCEVTPRYRSLSLSLSLSLSFSLPLSHTLSLLRPNRSSPVYTLSHNHTPRNNIRALTRARTSARTHTLSSIRVLTPPESL